MCEKREWSLSRSEPDLFCLLLRNILILRTDDFFEYKKKEEYSWRRKEWKQTFHQLKEFPLPCYEMWFDEEFDEEGAFVSKSKSCGFQDGEILDKKTRL